MMATLMTEWRLAAAMNGVMMCRRKAQQKLM